MYYLKIRHNLRLSLDPIYPTIDCETFKDNYWTDFYVDVKEAIYPNISNALGSSVDLCMMFDRNHAEKKNSQYLTGFLIFCNMALINCLSEKHPTEESAVCRYDFVVMKQRVKTLRGIRCRLRIISVHIKVPSSIYDNNISVICNTSRPEYVLKKKSKSVC